MLSTPSSRSFSHIDINQMELVEELTKLNSSLRLELEKCHNYIGTLEKDLKEAENRSNFSAVSERIMFIGENVEQERNKLREEVDRLAIKVKEKRQLAKKLEKQCQERQAALTEILRERDQLKMNLMSMQCSFDALMNEDKEKVVKLEAVMAEQRQTIQLYSRQLQGKAVVTEKLYNKVEDLQQHCAFITRQNEDLKLTNSSLTHNLQQLQKRHQEKEAKSAILIKQLQSKHLMAVSQVKRLNTSQSRTDLYSSRVSGNSIIIQSASRIWPVTKRISAQQHSLTKQVEVDRQQLLDQIHVLQQQNKREKQKVERLKNDIIAIKLQHSNLLSKNSQLSQHITRLQRTKNQLISKLQSFNTIRTIKQTERSVEEVNSINSKSSCNKTVTTIRRYPITPQDGEIPVHDKGCTKGQYVCLTNSFGDPRKSNIAYRQSAVNLTTLR